MDLFHFDKERKGATLFNVRLPTKNVPALNETIPDIFTQQLYSSEQRWEGITAQVYQLLPPKVPQCVQMDCDLVILQLHGFVDLQRQMDAEKNIQDNDNHERTYYFQGPYIKKP